MHWDSPIALGTTEHEAALKAPDAVEAKVTPPRRFSGTLGGAVSTTRAVQLTGPSTGVELLEHVTEVEVERAKKVIEKVAVEVKWTLSPG